MCSAGQIPALPNTPTAGGEETFLSLPLVFLAHFFRELLQPALFNQDNNITFTLPFYISLCHAKLGILLQLKYLGGR